MLTTFAEYIETLIMNMGAWAPILACILILLESILPVLPLCTFITVNFISFGSFWGFVFSWAFTCVGCFLSYYLVRKGFKMWSSTRFKTINLLDKCLNYVRNLSLPMLTVILAIPFTPAFMMNIAAGLSDVSSKKFVIAVLIGKIFMVYFWGYVGTNLIESFQSPVTLLKVGILIILAYVISTIMNKIIKDK